MKMNWAIVATAGVAAMLAGCVNMGGGQESERQMQLELETTRNERNRADQLATLRQADIERLQQETALLREENKALTGQRDALRAKLKDEQGGSGTAVRLAQEATEKEKAATARADRLEADANGMQLELRKVSADLSASRAEVTQLRDTVEKMRAGGDRALVAAATREAAGRVEEANRRIAELEAQLKARDATIERMQAGVKGREKVDSAELKRLQDVNTTLGAEVVRLRAALEGRRAASRPARP